MNFIVQYSLKETGDLIGYHLSTACQVGKEESAKIYSTLDTDMQLGIIRKNLIYMMKLAQQNDKFLPGFKTNNADEIELGIKYVDMAVPANRIWGNYNPITQEIEVFK